MQASEFFSGNGLPWMFLLWEGAPDALALSDSEGIVVRANAAYCQLYGYEPEEVIGHSFATIFPPEQRASAIAQYREVYTGAREAPAYETWIRRKDGSTRFVDARATVLRHEGRPVALLSIIRDITERKRAADIAEAERYFRTLTDSVPVMVWISSDDGRCTYVNKLWLDFTGRRAAQELDDGWLESIHPEDRAYARTTYDDAFRQRRPFRMEYRLRYLDGDYRWVLAHGVPRHNPDGLFVGYVGSAIDITDRRQAEEARRISEARLRRMVDANLIGIIFADFSGAVVEVNDAWLRITGYTREDVAEGRVNWAQITPPEYRPLDDASIDGLRRLGTHPPFEKEYIRKDGSRVPVLVGTALLDPETTLCVGFLVDLSERRRIEEALAYHSQLARTVTENAASALFLVDARGYPIYINPAGERMTGYTLDEIKDRPAHDTVHYKRLDGSPYPMEECPIDRAYPVLRTLREQEEVFVHKDGTLFPVTFSVAPLEIDGENIGAVVEFRDISERVHAEERQRFLAEATTALVSSLDYEATLNRMARLSVPFLADWAFIEMVQDDGSIHRLAIAHHDPARESLAKQYDQRFPIDPQAPEGSAKAIRTGQSELIPELPEVFLDAVSQDDEHRRILRDMQFRSAMIVPLVARGRVIGDLAFATDDSSNRRFGPDDLALAEELASRAALAIDNARLYRDAQLAVQAREEFLSIASHELRNPVAGITGAVQLLRRAHERGRLDLERLQRYLDLIQHGARRLADLTEDLLDVSRLQRGGLPLRPRLTDVAALVEAAVSRARTIGDSERVHLHLESRPSNAVVDPDRVEQVVENLLSNAVKYSPDGGAIQVILTAEGPDVVLRVQDSGIGVPPDALDQIFEPFGRASNAEDRHIEGLGLGLYICRQIAEQHGGSLRAESDGEGRGTTFVLRLPYSADSIDFAASASPSSPE